MTKPRTLNYNDFADYEINQLLVGDIRAAKQLVCVVNVIGATVDYEVICAAGVYRFGRFSEAVRKYNEV
ncbi:MAG: hypothetical protein ABIA63_04350 [bacterium]